MKGTPSTALVFYPSKFCVSNIASDKKCAETPKQIPQAKTLAPTRRNVVVSSRTGGKESRAQFGSG